MTMMKTYRAKSELSFNVRMGSGYRHVAFVPHTMGGSSLTTDDPQLQSAIEQHRFFGTLISVTVMREEKPRVAPATSFPVSQSPSTGSGDGPASGHPALSSDLIADVGSADANLQVLSFSSLFDAREYMADQWGISRTHLRFIEQIKRAAYEHGYAIELEGQHPESSLSSPYL